MNIIFNRPEKTFTSYYKYEHDERKILESQNNEKQESKIRSKNLLINLIKSPLAKVYGTLLLITLFIVSIVVRTDVIYTTYSEGYILVAKVNIWEGNAKWGYMNESSQMAIPFKYDDADDFHEGLAAVKLHRRWGYINKYGTLAIPFKYDSALPFYDGIAVIGLNHKLGFIDKHNNIIIPFRYDSIRLCGTPGQVFHEGIASVELNGKWGAINKLGEEIVPFKYQDVGLFSNGLAPVALNGKYGYIDINGNEAIPLKYDYATPFDENGIARVNINDNVVYIDKMGKQMFKIVNQFVYDLP